MVVVLIIQYTVYMHVQLLRADTNVVKVNEWGDEYPNLVVVLIYCMYTLTFLPQVAFIVY